MRKSQGIFLLLIVVIFNSCTIEKRVHQPGYYISFKNAKLINVSSTSEVAHTNDNEQVEIVKAFEGNNEFKQNIENHSISNEIEESNESFKVNPTSKITQNKVESTKESNHSEKHQVVSNKKDLKLLSPFKSTEVNSKGIMMLIIGLLLLGLALVFYNFLGVIGLIFAIIFVISGGIYFLIGLGVLIFNL